MFDKLLAAAERLAEDFVQTNMTRTDAAALGLDPRAAYELWRNDYCVAVPKSQRGTFDYYGGAQYVDRQFVFELGDYVFYAAEDERVAGWLGLNTDEEVIDPIDDFNYVGSKHHY